MREAITRDVSRLLASLSPLLGRDVRVAKTCPALWAVAALAFMVGCASSVPAVAQPDGVDSGCGASSPIAECVHRVLIAAADGDSQQTAALLRGLERTNAAEAAASLTDPDVAQYLSDVGADEAAVLLLGEVDVDIDGYALNHTPIADDADFLYGNGTALVLAASGGFEVALWADGSGTVHTVSAAPLLSELVVSPLSDFGGDHHVAALVARADRALRSGDVLTSWRLLTDAIERMGAVPDEGEVEPTCGSRAELQYLHWRLGKTLQAGVEESLSDLARLCLDAEVRPDDANRRDFLTRLVQFDQNLGSASDPNRRLRAWLHPEDRARATDELQELGSRLQPRRAALLQSLMARVQLASGEPDGWCDLDYDERLETDLDANDRQLRSLGRADYVVARIVDRAGVDERESVRTQLLESVETAWLWRGILSGSARCDEMYSRLSHEVENDDIEGYQSRNNSRLFEGFTVFSRCPDETEGPRALLDAILGRTQAENDPQVALATLLSTTTIDAVVAFLTGGDQAGTASAVFALAEAMYDVRQRLGDGQDDRVLGAIIDVYMSLVSRFGGAEVDSQAVLERANATFAAARDTVTADSSALVAWSPALHLVTLLALNLFDGPDVWGPQLLDAAESDVRAIMTLVGHSEFSDNLVATVRAAGILFAELIETQSAASLLDVVGAGDASELLSDLGVPSSAESWWAVGFGLATAILWDVYAVERLDEATLDVAGATAALGRANEILETTVTRALSDFEVAGTNWEMLRLLPALHRVGAGSLILDVSFVDYATEQGLDLQAAVAGVVGGLSSAAGDADTEQPPTLIDLFIDLLREISELPAEELLADDWSGVARVGQQLAVRARAYPADLRFHSDLLSASLVYLGDSEASEPYFASSRAAAREGSLSRLDYLPQLLHAALQVRRSDAPASDVLSTLNEVLASGDEALSCDRAHPVHALLPHRAWLHVRLGDNDSARADLSLYQELVEAGFDGEANLHCELLSSRNNMLTNMTLTTPLGDMIWPLGQQGAFQMGLGFQSNLQHDDRIICTGWVPGVVQVANLIQSRLAESGYALLQGADAEANRSILAALDLLDEVAQQNEYTTDPDRLPGLEQAVELIDPDLLTWVSMMARLRGQIAAADALLERSYWFAPLSVEDAESPRIPHPFRSLDGMDALGAAVAGWSAFDTNISSADLLVEALDGLSDADGSEAWSIDAVLYSAQLRQRSNLGFATLEPNLDRLPEAATQVRELLSAFESPEQNIAEILNAVQRIVDAGLYTELGWLSLFPAVDPALLRRVAEAAAAALPADSGVDRARYDLILEAGLALNAAGYSLDAAQALAAYIEARSGLMRLDHELEWRRWVVFTLGTNGQFDEMLHTQVTHLASLLSDIYGDSDIEIGWIRVVEYVFDVWLSPASGAQTVADVMPAQTSAYLTDEVVRMLGQTGTPEVQRAAALEALTALFEAYPGY